MANKQILIVGDLSEAHREALDRAKELDYIWHYVTLDSQITNPQDSNLPTHNALMCFYELNAVEPVYHKVYKGTTMDDDGNSHDHYEEEVEPLHFATHWMIMKGANITTHEFLKKVIPLAKHHDASAFLSHCAIFDNGKQNFILTDAACVVSPLAHERYKILRNAQTLFNMIYGRDECNISILSAGGDNGTTNLVLHEWYKNQKQTNWRMEQLDVALNENIRKIKNVPGSVADIVMVDNINEGNHIWKTLTTMADGWKVAGLLTGARFPIILNSRGDSVESLLYSIEMAIRM